MKQTARTVLRRALAALLCAVLLLAPVYAAGAQTGVYSPDDALAYAADHWNDGVGLCGTFVSACVTAGGIEVNEPGPGTLYRRLLPYGTPYLLTPTGSKYLITGTENAGKVAPGDPLFFFCETCGGFCLHAALCSSIDADGYLRDYAHNNAHNNKIVYENLKRSDHPQPAHKVVLYALHMNGTAPFSAGSSSNKDGSVTLQWEAVENAVSYSISILPATETGAAADPILTVDALTAPTCTVSLPEGSYTATVTAVIDEKLSVTVALDPFEVSATVPAPPEQEPETPSAGEPDQTEETVNAFVKIIVQVFTAVIRWMMQMFKNI